MIISNLTAYVPAYAGTEPATRALALANALFAELANYGIVMERELHERIASLPDEQLALTVVRDILDELTVGADVELNAPLFPNWEDRQFMTVRDCFVQIYGYMFRFDGNMLNDPNFTDEIHRNVDYAKVKVLRLASETEFTQYFDSLINANTALDRGHIKRLKFVFALCSQRLMDLKERIRSAEIRVMAMLELSLSLPLDEVFRKLRCEPVDALRYAAALRNFETLKLPSDVLYASLTWQQRLAILKFWEGFDFERLGEAMGQKREAWKRFFEHIHLFGQERFQRYPKAYIAAAVSIGSREDFIPTKLRKQLGEYKRAGLVEVTDGGALAYRTFASRVESAAKRGDTQALLGLVEQRPGWAFANLSTVFNGVPHREAEGFAERLVGLLPRVQPKTWLALLGVNPEATHRRISITDRDGNSKDVVRAADYGPAFRFFQQHIIQHIRNAHGFSGRVVVEDPEVRDRIVPFISRNSELDRGSSQEVDVSKGYLYLMLHWIQQSLTTDLDLSLIAFDADWNHQIVYYGAQSLPWLHHSGDFTSAPGPKGSTEYGRIDLDKIPANVRYVLPVFNVFAGERFGECRVCRAGFLASDSERFELTQDGTYYDVNAKSMLHVPFAYDVRENRITTIEYNQEHGSRYNSAHSYIEDLKSLIVAAESEQPVTIGQLADWLSGNGPETDLTITETPDTENGAEIAPDRLFTLFER